jgi:hypothetical protein
MLRVFFIFLLLTGCSGLSWNTEVANDPDTRLAMLRSAHPGVSTEADITTRWGNPTQKVREGGETRFIYRDMRNPPGYLAPQFGNSAGYVVIVFQYGVVSAAYSSETEGCQGTFAPRPPGYGFYNPTTVKPVNCGDAGRSRTVSPDAGISGIESGKL